MSDIIHTAGDTEAQGGDLSEATLRLVAEAGREPRANPVFFPLHGLPSAKARETPAITRGNGQVRGEGNAVNNKSGCPEQSGM